MSEVEILRGLIENLGTIGIGGSFVVVAWILTRAIVPMWEASISSADAQRTLEQRRMENEVSQALGIETAINSLTTQMQMTTTAYKNVAMIMGTLPTGDDVHGMETRLTTIANGHSDALSTVGNNVRSVPAEVWRIGDNKLEALKKSIEQMIQTTERQILEKLDPQAEMAGMSGMIQRLAEIVTTIDRFSLDSEPGVSKHPIQEKT